ncbi:MAG: radical SAM family heme chaperone HemW [Cyclobacteriaceae bacterium]
MSGIYIHVPFCKQACFYCDFHFSTNLNGIEHMHQAICNEVSMRKQEGEGEIIKTIYFGGGTPSIFSDKMLHEILDSIHSSFEVGEQVEITLEANPDDLTKTKLKQLKSIGINRLSIGIQTFDNSRLKYINRIHSSNDSERCVRDAQEIGFDNLTVDLIYAIPPQEMDYWKRDLEKVIELNLPHISLYGLTIEEKTVFGKWLAKGKFHETSEELAAKQYRLAIDTLTNHGYNHYEVSNFAIGGFESKHNSAYWSGEKYIGIGPGAHSYDTYRRSYNVSNNSKYIASIADRKIPKTIELLSDSQKRNEYILTRLRTASGIDLIQFQDRFGVDLVEWKSEEIQSLVESRLIKNDPRNIALTVDGFMVADEIALRLFFDE